MAVLLSRWLHIDSPRVMRTPRPLPSRPVPGRIRVLLECAPEHSPMVMASILDRANFDVVVCEGPKGKEKCPMTTGDRCPAVERTEVVVNMLGSDSPERSDILPSMIEAGTPPPSVVVMFGDAEEAIPGVRSLSPFALSGDLIHEVRSATASV